MCLLELELEVETKTEFPFNFLARCATEKTTIFSQFVTRPVDCPEFVSIEIVELARCANKLIVESGRCA